ncbi:MAG: permease-like cell division protein FtsX [Acidimicrobiales bacterium]
MAPLVIMAGVDGLNARFKGDVEFIIWVDKDATEQNVQGIQAALESSPNVSDQIYVNREETFREFQEFWADSPSVLEAVTPEQLPTSFRVTPTVAELALVEALGRDFEGLPGVQSVD